MDKHARLAFLALGLFVGLFVGGGVAWVAGHRQIAAAELARTRVARDLEIERSKHVGDRDRAVSASTSIEAKLRAAWRSERSDEMPNSLLESGLKRCDDAALAIGRELAQAR